MGSKGIFLVLTVISTACLSQPSFAACGETKTDSLRALETRGRECLGEGNISEAYEACRRLIDIDPLSAEMVEEIADSFLVEEKWEEAVGFYRIAAVGHAEAGSVHPNLHYKIGICILRLDRYAAAAEEFRKCIAYDPENKAYQYSLLLAFYSGKMWDETIIEGLAFTNWYPDDARGWHILGMAYKGKGMDAEAEEAERRFRNLRGR